MRQLSLMSEKPTLTINIVKLNICVKLTFICLHLSKWLSFICFLCIIYTTYVELMEKGKQLWEKGIGFGTWGMDVET